MGKELVKNILSMNFGTIFMLFLNFLTVPLYIRIIGLEGYAVIGIIFSFNQILNLIRIPSFLGLIKNKISTGNRILDNQRRLYSTILNSMLIFSAAIVGLGFIISLALIRYIHKDLNLAPFFIIGLCILFLERIIEFLIDFIRANGNELNVQKAMIPSEIIGTTLTISLMLFLSKGTIAIFIGILISKIIQLIILILNSKIIRYYRFILEWKIFKRFFRAYSFEQFKIETKDQLLRRSGLFISTLILPENSIGIITLFVSLQEKARKLYRSVWMHLSPIFESTKDNQKNCRILKHFNIINIIVFVSISTILITVGKFVYLEYFGENVKNTFHLFLPFILSTILYLSFMHYESFLFVKNIKAYQNILSISLLIFIISIVPLVLKYKLIGFIIACIATNIIRIILIAIFIEKSIRKSIRKIKLIENSCILLMSIIISYMTNNIIYQTIAMLLIIITILIVNIKNIKLTYNSITNL